jgi:voltage-gated potassium channel
LIKIKPRWIAIFIIFLGVYNIIFARISILPFRYIFGIFTKAIVAFTGFSSLLVGFLLTIVGYGLYQEYKLFFRLSFLLLLISATINFFQENIPGALISTFLLAALYIERNAFSRPLPFKFNAKYLVSFWIILFVIVYGTIGSLHFGSEYNPPIKSGIQALYYTIITVTTVGYGDYIPVTDSARLFAISLIFVGVGSFISAIAIIFQPLMKKLEERAIKGL